MNRDEIIKLAREAGWDDHHCQFDTRIERFAEKAIASAVAVEREACAQVCDAIAKKMDDEGEGPTGYIAWVAECASTIRARGEK